MQANAQEKHNLVVDAVSGKIQVNRSYIYLLRVDKRDGLGIRVENNSLGDCSLQHGDLIRGLEQRIGIAGFQVRDASPSSFLRLSYHCQKDQSGHYLIGYRIGLEQKPVLPSAIDRALSTRQGNGLYFPLMDVMGVLHLDADLLYAQSYQVLMDGADQVLAKLEGLKRDVDALRSGD